MGAGAGDARVVAAYTAAPEGTANDQSHSYAEAELPGRLGGAGFLRRQGRHDVLRRRPQQAVERPLLRVGAASRARSRRGLFVDPAGTLAPVVSSSLPSSFYQRDGARFVSTALTRGPWSNDHQHGGPPSALLGRAVRSFGADAASFFVARMTIDLLRPVPITPLTLRTSLARDGKRVQRVEAVLLDGDTELARALGLRVRTSELALTPVATPAPLTPPPEGLPPYTFHFFRHEVGYHRGIELRYAEGTWGGGPVTAWMRTLAPLVEGEADDPLERVLALVDAESGVCPPLPPDHFTFVNPDLTLYLERPLSGEWLGLAARSTAHAHGLGLAESALFDREGLIGRSAQSLLITPRAGQTGARGD